LIWGWDSGLTKTIAACWWLGVADVIVAEEGGVGSSPVCVGGYVFCIAKIDKIWSVAVLLVSGGQTAEQNANDEIIDGDHSANQRNESLLRL
jgi:hypothetical protein